jgi:hypothetical protein
MRSTSATRTAMQPSQSLRMEHPYSYLQAQTLAGSPVLTDAMGLLSRRMGVNKLASDLRGGEHTHSVLFLESAQPGCLITRHLVCEHTICTFSA